MRLAAVVLAAGMSSRMGANKLLLKVGDRRVIEHILFSLKPIETTVVTGHRPEEIRDIAESLGAETVHNPDYEEGMTTSFQAGLRTLDPEVDAVFMVLSDTFGSSTDRLGWMADKMEDDPKPLIVSPVYQWKRGHPVLFRSPLFEEFLGLEGGETMRDVVNRHEDRHKYVESDIWCRIDLDTPEDYERVKALWSERQVS
ncbi:nucleotidyltransferase family protein [Candidatus Bathyarchaeota archaeon]|nr:nucleotidyltransferase family protein [Candidatus Bathyarchaeota archaeon]